ncbi:hypothetical protein EVAR_27507_1 [Eumeta japonica]|uniref:Uncharacterized protein n=1 Tax=Eumeta variegata TaxID=151549 RepID=A0A4C1XEV5_EUMVA|nr:hypothetical protein EVAR_27507_1 [Eumeta japonica]
MHTKKTTTSIPIEYPESFYAPFKRQADICRRTNGFIADSALRFDSCERPRRRRHGRDRLSRWDDHTHARRRDAIQMPYRRLRYVPLGRFALIYTLGKQVNDSVSLFPHV